VIGKFFLLKFLFGCFFLISYSLCVLFYIINGITGTGIDQSVIYLLRFGLEGSGFMDFRKDIFKGFSMLIFGLFFAIYFYGFQIKFKKNIITNLFRIFTKQRFKINSIVLSSILLILSIIVSPITITLASVYFEKPPVSDVNSDFYNYYKVPSIVSDGKSKNLVFIYLESLERTYFDQNAFPGLVNNLKEIEENSISFTNIKQDDYSHFTIAGLTASQCGVPLVSPAYWNSVGGMNTFMESATCLGDLLDNEGYFLSYYSGANIRFAGTDIFMRTHSFDDVKGYYELAVRPNKYTNWWGLYDDSLFSLAKQNIEKLAKEKEKFAFFMSTIDTHHPSGNPSRSCDGIIYGNGKNSILNSVKCSDLLVSKFVDDLRKTDYGKDLVIVIVSDHLSMENTASYILDKQDRTNLFMINTPETNKTGGQKNNTAGLTLDIGTTILPFIGYNGLIGLGRDLSQRDENNDARIKDYLDKLVSDWRPEVLKMWNFPRVKNEIKVALESNKIYIDQRSFQIPLIIELNDDLDTIMNFEISDNANTILDRYPKLYKLNKNTPYIVIDKCLFFENIKPEDISDNYCLIWGRKDVFSDYKVLNSNIDLNRDDILKLINYPQV